MWLGKLTALDMDPSAWVIGPYKTSTKTNRHDKRQRSGTIIEKRIEFSDFCTDLYTYFMFGLMHL